MIKYALFIKCPEDSKLTLHSTCTFCDKHLHTKMKNNVLLIKCKLLNGRTTQQKALKQGAFING